MAASLKSIAQLHAATSRTDAALTRLNACAVSIGLASSRPTSVLPPIPSKPYVAARLSFSRQPIRFRTAATNGDGFSGSDDMTEDELKRAYDEAAALYSAAHSISNLQIQQELQQSVPKDAFNSTDPVLTHEQVASFFLEQGLSDSEAKKLSFELRSQGREYTLQQLSFCVARWDRVLPDANVAAMILKDSTLLDADVGAGLTNLIRLVEAFPGKDVVSMIMKQPRLLWCEDLAPRIGRSRAQLVSIHPSGDHDVVNDIILEYPELLYRMDYYSEATLLDELPIEIQNMMVVADQGIGFIFRYYKNKSTNYAAEVDPRRRNHFFEQEL